ncbi:CGNR zinc finger domain-containing protein [Homoserinibacter sp. YIM 151385]|uniref:CGNR zinc finger domain-containing protein n=1 Tax=Homoserinibacter sp. YIM 151385 TaxID=2985506 RepID=UPI0022F0B39D|nr:CGNR zinc finger domain-containing protein [Homoserinibacter sp. YIM 151385]WBU37632.1 CGNR zinc finger domain-containing protein [Homoserinibacter sp. YIM 151385]
MRHPSDGPGQWIISGDGRRWRFDAGAPSLDFAYTGDRGLGVDAWERLREPRDLGAWLAEREPRLAAEDAGPRELLDALALRGAISRLATAVVDGEEPAPDDVDTLNLYAAMPDIPPALPGGARQAGAGRLRVAQALSSLARDAIAVLGEDEGRLRRCEADDCRLVFRDESRTRNRRWCSMQRCGNRAKVRAHRERAAAARAARVISRPEM